MTTIADLEKTIASLQDEVAQLKRDAKAIDEILALHIGLLSKEINLKSVSFNGDSSFNDSLKEWYTAVYGRILGGRAG